MAPPPEYDKEPKAPDKCAKDIANEDPTAVNDVVNDHLTTSEAKSANSTSNTEVENNKNVETLDDDRLRALLDEAITYKSPKDREGKSILFQELLQVVEQDEKACEVAAREFSGARAGRRGIRGRAALAHSNSMQDMMASLTMESMSRRPRQHPPAHSVPVSGRATHGGSLPSGVDTTFLAGEEPVRISKEYVATVQCVNPSPHVERRVSASDAQSPAETEQLNRSKPIFPVKYTSCASFEVGGGSGCSGRAVTTTTPSNQVDSAISFSCITTPEVVASTNITSTSQSAVAVDTKPLQLESCYRAVASLTGTASVWSQRRAGAQQRTASPPSNSRIATKEEQPRSVVSSSINGLPLLRSSYGANAAIATAPASTSASAPPDEHKKSLDENGNSVQSYSSPQSGSSQHKKHRRKKSSKNETVINLHQIDGYQGNKDVNELMRFIEPESGRSNKLGRSKHKDDSDHKDKKRSTERRKDKENKVKRATSLEELSRTTLADLTDKPTPAAPPRRANAAAKPERRSWGDDARHAFYFREQELAPDVEAELTDFQTVTKKRRSRRRTDEPVPRRTAAPSPRAVRRSAPPSDRSNDSNDDMDSVHSLPADAPPARPPAHPPHASYADIARTRHNIPDLIESCNFYTEGDSRTAPRTEETGPPGPSDADGYPALEPRGGARRPRDGKPGAGNTCVGRRERKEQPEAAQPAVECPAPDVVADRRPAVILLDAGARPRDMDGVTFGFDINEQLLQPARRARCDLLCEALEAGSGSTTSAIGDGVAVGTGCGTLRYLPPAPLHDTRHLNQIVDYVGNAWEDVMRCGAGKVRYFNE